MEIKNNNPKDTKEEFFEKINKDPSNEENYLELGKLFIGEQDYKGAL